MVKFDELFERYCGAALKRGATVRLFLEDTDANKLIAHEFRTNYLVQRAQFENWSYDQSFRVISNR